MRRVAVAAVGLQAVAGVVLGLVWAWVSPRPQARWVGRFWYAPEDVGFAGAQVAWFALMGAVLGLVVGVYLGLMADREGPAKRVACWLAGSCVGSGLAWLVGMLVSGSLGFHAASDAWVTAPLGLTAPGALMIWPVATAAATALVTLFRSLFSR